MPTDFFGRVMVVFQRYGMSMLQGAGVSIRIALVGTIVGCIIGFAVGIVQTIPVEAKDNPIKKAVLWVIKLIMNASAFRLKLKHVAGRIFYPVHQYRCLHG